MTQPDTKDEERQVFELFARAARLPVVAGSIEQPEPAPDVLCGIDGLGRVAFELTRLDDTAELTSKLLWLSTGKLWEQTLAGLSDEQRSDLRHRYADADIALVFVEHADQRKRRAAIQGLALHLLTLLSGYSGSVRVDSRQAIAIRSAEIRRYAMRHGPLVRELHASWLKPVDLSRIDKKLDPGEYTVSERLELLAYSRWNGPLASDARDFHAYLAARIPGSRFARAWLFEVMTGRVIAHYP
jgi:hypothetical protein